MKKALKKIGVYLLYYTRLYKLVFYFKHRCGKEHFTILVYHSFSENRKHPFKLDCQVFEKHLCYLKKNYRIFSLSDIVKKLRNSQKLEKNTLCLTIDDGFLDNYEFAYPILKRHSLPATIFVAAGYIEGRAQVNITEKHLIHNATIEDKYKNSEIYKLPQLPMMTWKQVKEMSEDCIEIGAHTINHPILTKVPLDIAKSEIKSSKIVLEEILNKKIKLFAFPNGMKGDYNDELCQIVQSSGYDAAFTVEWGINTVGDDLYRLKRIPISNLNIAEFALKINCLVSDP
jgi:peptidoglycan/xylan/chitin deacetylase (PgdA/CDA1 family)